MMSESDGDVPLPARAFALVADSNLRPHINKTNCRAHPMMKSAQVLSCGSSEVFIETLRQVKTAADVCIVACLTSFISSAEGSPIVSHRVDPVLQDIRSVLLEICFDNPNRHFTISPPMYRAHPVWYREGLPEILTIFSQTLTADRPPNLHLLPSFATPEFCSDGVSLTAYSGLEFILHLFEASQDLLSRLDSPIDQICARSGEGTRVLEDRVMALEQDHRRLNRVFESKAASDAELADFHANERFEDSFAVFGLAPIIDLVGKAWQEKAIKDVQGVLVALMGREYKIVFVKNSTSRAKDSETCYNVQLADVHESRQIRKKFGSFYFGGKDSRPDALRHINIKNLTTADTKIRISVLKLLAARYRASNPGSRVQVVSHAPRPMIRITPPTSASDRRILNYNYIDAVRKLPCNFTPEEVAPIIRRIRPELVGQVRSVFVVLCDDQFRQQLRQFESRSKSKDSAAQPQVVGGPVVPQPSGSVLPPPGLAPSGHKSRSGKRGASSALGSTSKK